MKIGDIMTHEVITVRADATVSEAASIMLKERISGLPVVSHSKTLLGIVTEGDLLRRVESGTQKTRPHWLEFIVGPKVLAGEYIHSHARLVDDVMTRGVAVATEDMALDEAVDLMERGGVKRLPVVRDGRVVGIVARANFLHAIAASPPQAKSETNDKLIREQLERELSHHSWNAHQFHIVIKDGVVDVWGFIKQERFRDAIRVAAQNVPGVKSVRDHLMWFEPYTGVVMGKGTEGPGDILH